MWKLNIDFCGFTSQSFSKGGLFALGIFLLSISPMVKKKSFHRFSYASTDGDVDPFDIYGRNVGGFGLLV